MYYIVSFASTQLTFSWQESSHKQYVNDECGCVLIKLYLPKHVAAEICAMDHSLPVSAIKGIVDEIILLLMSFIYFIVFVRTFFAVFIIVIIIMDFYPLRVLNNTKINKKVKGR